MSRLTSVTLLLLGVVSTLAAIPDVPEINPAFGSSALALITGAVLVVRSRKR